ncbi:MAG: DUF3231 family protein [Caulobacteraceae bacterium]
MSKNSFASLDSAEINSLWTTYMNDSLVVHMLKCFLRNVQDNEVRSYLQSAYNISEKHLESVSRIFNQEGFPIPAAFTAEDINENAPRLFSDTFYLFYMANMAKFGMTTISMALYHSARSDVRSFFSQAVTDIKDFNDRLTDMMLARGIFIRSPIVQVSKEISFVEKKSFFNGLLVQPRPLLTVEVLNVFANILTNLVGKPMLVGFAQTAKSDEIKDYMMRGKAIIEKHNDIFASLFNAEGIPVASTPDAMATDSITAPYSDKLMMFHITLLNVTSLRNYTDALVTSLRNDLHADFLRLSAEISQYTSDGMEIMIKNGWMEQPPQVILHEALVGV